MCTVVPNTITEKHNGKGEGSVVFKKLLYLCIGVAREGLNLNRGVASACVHAGFFVPEAGLEKVGAYPECICGTSAQVGLSYYMCM